MRNTKKVLMITIINPENDSLLCYWFKHLEYEKSVTNNVELEALVLMSKMNDNQASKTAEVADDIVHFLNIGDKSTESELLIHAWNTAFQYAILGKFDYVYMVKINFHPCDGALMELLKIARKKSVGIVSSVTHMKKDNNVFIEAKILKSNILGLKQAADEKKNTVWVDMVSLGTALIKKEVFMKFQMGQPSRIKNVEYAFTNKVKRNGFNVVISKDVISLFLEQEGIDSEGNKSLGVW